MTDKPMKAICVTEYGDPDVLEVVEVETPSPGEGEIRVDVRAAGVNFADIEKRQGNYPDGPLPPYRPGMEIAGVVEATGAGVDLSVGDRVAALVSRGGYAEHAIAPTDAVISIPETLPFPEAAALPVQYLTAHNTLFEWGALEAGERVLVTAAAGGVGTAAVQLADAAGTTVVAVASTEEKRTLARQLGAARVIDYDAIETEENRIDLALDGVGGQVFTNAVKTLSPGGRVITFGMASGRVPTVATPRLFFQNRSVIGYHLMEALHRNPDKVLGAVPSLFELISSGTVEIIVDEMAPLSEAVRVHERLQCRESRGKLVLVP